MDEENQVDENYYRQMGLYDEVPQNTPQNDTERYLNGNDPVPTAEYSPEAATLKGQVTKTTTLDAYYKYYGDRWQATEEQIRRANAMWEVLNGRAQYADVEAHLEATNADPMRDRRISQFQKDHRYDPLLFADEAFASLPFMRDTLVAAGASGTAFAGAGATAALIGGQAGPQIATPEEAVTVPVTSVLSWGTGAEVGLFAKSAQLMMGMHYDESRRAGVPHDLAVQGAIASGLVQGMLEATQWKLLGAAARKTMAIAMGGAEARGAIQKSIQLILTQMGLAAKEGGVEAAQTLTEETVRYFERAASGVQQRDWNDVRKDIWKSWKAGAKASVATGGATSAAGFVAAKAMPRTAAALMRFAADQSELKDDPDFVEGKNDTRLEDIVKRQTVTVLEGRISTSGMTTDDVKYELRQAETALKDLKQHNDAINKEIAGYRAAKMSVPDDRKAEHTRIVRAVSRTQDYISLLEHQLALNEAAEALADDRLNAKQKERLAESADKIRKELDSKLVGVAKQQAAGHIESLTTKLEKLSAEVAKDVQDRIITLQGQISEKQQLRDSITDPASFALKDQLNQETEDLKIEQHQLEQFLDTGDKSLAPTRLKGKVGKLEALADERGHYQQLTELIDNKLLTPEDVKALAIKLPTRSAKNLIEKAIKVMASTAKSAARDQKITDKEKLQLLRGIVNTSSLDAAQKAKLLDFVAAKGLEGNFVKHIETLEARIEKREEAEKVREAKAALNRVLDASEGVDKRGSQDQTRFTYDGDQILAMYRELIDDPEKAEKVLADEQARLDAQAVAQDAGAVQSEVPHDAIQVAIANDVVGFNNKSTAEIDAVTRKIRNIMATGRMIQQEKIAERDARRANMLSRAMSLVQGTKPVALDSQGNVVQKPKGVVKKIGGLGDDILAQFHTWDQLWESVFADSLEGDRSVFDLHDTVQQEETNVNTQAKIAMNYMTEGLEPKDAAKVLAMLSDPKLKELSKDPIEFVLQDGSIIQSTVDGETELGKRYSIDQAMQLVAAFKCKQKRRGLKDGNQFTFKDASLNSDAANDSGARSTQQALEDFIKYGEDPITTAIVDGAVKYYENSFDAFNKEHIDEYGRPLEKIENYPGYMPRVHDGFVEGSYQERRARMNDRASLTPNMAKEITPNVKPYRDDIGLTQNLWRYIQDVEGWKAWRKTEPDVRAVLSNRTLRNMIAEKRGKEFLNSIDALFGFMSGTRQKQVASEFHALDAVRSKFAVAAQGFNPVTATKQMSGVLNFLQHESVTPESTQKAVDEFFADPMAAMDKLASTQYMRNRAGSLISELKGRLHRGERVTNWDQRAMALITQSDRLANITGGYVVYVSVRDKALASGASAIQAERAGLAAFERVGNRIQSSGTSDQRVRAELNSWGRTFTLFRKQPLQVFGQEVNLWRRAIANPKQNAGQLAKSIVVNRAAQALFSGIGATASLAFASGHGGEDFDKEVSKQQLKLARDVLATGISAPPIVGDLIPMMIGIFQKYGPHPDNLKEKDINAREVSIPLFDQINAVGTIADLVAQRTTDHSISDGEFWKGIRAVATLAGGAPGAAINTGAFFARKAQNPADVEAAEKARRKADREKKKGMTSDGGFKFTDDGEAKKSEGDFKFTE